MRTRIQPFGVPMDPWTMDETVRAIGERVKRRQFTQHVVVNVAKIVNMQTDEELREAVVGCDLINIDGMGVVWGARFLGYDVPERVAGVDLFDKLLAWASDQGESVYLLGAREPVVADTAEKLRQRFPELNIAGWHHGYWKDDREVVDKVRESGASMLFVAVTSPKKERFIHRWKDELGVCFAMGVGGTFDIVAGVTRRAPEWMRRYGLEWLYRVIQEPGRMWKRYLITNLKFAGMLVRARLRR